MRFPVVFQMECRLGTSKSGGRVEAGVGAMTGRCVDVIGAIAVNLAGAMLRTDLYNTTAVTNDKGK